MWILPKSIISRFAQDTEVLISDLDEYYRLCATSLTVKSKFSQSQTWCRRLKADNLTKHLFSRTLKPSMQSRFEEWLISFQAASHVSHSVVRECEKVQTILDTCSQISNELSWNVNQKSSSLKMSKGLFPQNLEEKKTPVFSSMCWSDWKKWVTEQRQGYSVRKKLAHRIDESGSLSQVFPTMTVSDSFGSRRATAKKEHWKSHAGTTLTDAVQNYPTPKVSDAEGAPHKLNEKGERISKKGVKWGVKLQDAIAHQEKKDNWTTPTVVMRNETAENFRERQLKWKHKYHNHPTLNIQVEMQEKGINWAWATPNTMDHLPPKNEEALKKQAQGARKGRARPSNLREQVDEKAMKVYQEEKDMENWGTPQASDHVEGARTNVDSNQKCLGRDLNQLAEEAKKENYPTPTTRDWKGASGKGRQEKKGNPSDTLPNHIQNIQADQNNHNNGGNSQEQSEKPKKLSCLWVAQLMGIPPHWCVPIEMMHSECSEME